MASPRSISVGIAAGAALAVASLGGVSGAAAGNGISSQSPTQIVSSAVQATKGASSFTLNGTFFTGNQSFGFGRLSMSNTGNARGAFIINGATLSVLGVNNVFYIKGSKAFWTKAANSSAAQMLGDKWVYGGPSNTGFSSFTSILMPSALTQKLFSSSSPLPANLRKAGFTTIAGQRVIRLTGSKGSAQGAIYIATTGTPYVVRIFARKGSDRGTLTFTNYGKPVVTNAPSGAINLSQIQHSNG